MNLSRFTPRTRTSRIFTACLAAFAVMMAIMGDSCSGTGPAQSTATETGQVNQQQDVYLRDQPIPFYNYSLARAELIQIYDGMNRAGATYSYSVSLQGKPIFGCPSVGMPLPANDQLTNPAQATDYSQQDHNTQGDALTSIGLAEPNGIYSSPSTAGTWIMCALPNGNTAPVYSEPNVVSFPFPVRWNGSMLVYAGGKSSINLHLKSGQGGTVKKGYKP